jgi:hypothetical protein
MRVNVVTVAAFAATVLATACGALSVQSQDAPGATSSIDLSGLPKPQVTLLPVDSPTHLLFVGNSYLYYGDSVHNHVRRLVIEAGLHESDALTYKSATIGGAALRDHNIEHLLAPENLRVAAPFQAVIMQGHSAAALSPDNRARFMEAARRFAGHVEAAGGVPVLYMTHAYVEPNRRASPEMIEQVATLYIETGNEIGALVIPVGLAFEEAYRLRPDLSLHAAFDGSHPNQAGTYLAAATVFAALYDASPVGLDYTYFGEVDPETARFLQGVAYTTTNEFFERD